MSVANFGRTNTSTYLYLYITIAHRGLLSHTNLKEIMDRDSFDVTGFDLGLLLQRQMRVANNKGA